MNVRFDQVGLMNDIKDRMMMMKRREEEKKKKKKKKSGSWGGIYVVGVGRNGGRKTEPTKY